MGSPSKVTYMTNIPPLTELIPEIYGDQRKWRTVLGTYLRNAAVIENAQKFNIHIADFFMPTLYMNDRGIHKDAVHVISDPVQDALLGAMCNMEEAAVSHYFS